MLRALCALLWACTFDKKKKVSFNVNCHNALCGRSSGTCVEERVLEAVPFGTEGEMEKKNEKKVGGSEEEGAL